jgi:DNA adenine methylase
MLSNSSAPLIRELYHDFRIEEVQATRAINSDPLARGTVTELVVLNY